MTDFDAFSPDPIQDEEDPFGAPAEPAAEAEDPFANSGGAQDEDPFGGGGDAPAEEAATFDASAFEPAQENGTEEAAADPFGGAEDEPATLEPEDNSAEDDVLPPSAVFGEWQEKRAAEMRTRRDEAREKKEAQIDTAKQELADFLAQRQTRLTKIKSNNLEEEKTFIADMETTMANGTTWEKVHKLVNLTPKPNEKPGTSKVDRMRALLIQLKHDS